MIYVIVFVELGVRIGVNVEIGFYLIIGVDVEIGDNIVIGLYVVIKGYICIGCENCIFQFCLFGEVLQDKKYVGELMCLEIGDWNMICEFCIFNFGIVQDVGVIWIGDDNWIMVYVYIVYDCQVGNKIIFVNNFQLVGYVIVDDWVIFGGFIGIYQFCWIGVYVMMVVGIVVLQDVLFYLMVVGNMVMFYGINVEGLKCCGFMVELLIVLKCVYCMLYKFGLLFEEVKFKLVEEVKIQFDVQCFVDFLQVFK